MAENDDLIRRHRRMMTSSNDDSHESAVEERPIPPNGSSQPVFIGDVNVVKSYGKVHLGTRAMFNGPVCITGLDKKNIITINEMNCICRKEKDQKKMITKNLYQRINKYKIQITVNKKLNLWKTFIVFFSLLLLQIIFTFIAFYKSNTSKEYQCSGINPNVLRNIRIMNNELENNMFTARLHWAFENDCIFNCCVKNKKSVVRISIIHSSLLQSVLDKFRTETEAPWWHLFANETRRQMSNLTTPLKDIYYNYIIGLNGYIFEGRSLTCPYEEDQENLKQDHSKTIVLGIPYCLPGDSTTIKIYTRRLLKAKDALLERLQYLNVLQTKFTLEFPDVCNNTKLLDMLLKDQISKKNLVFYDYFKKDPLSNNIIQSYNLLASNLTFEPIENIGTSSAKNLTGGGDSLYLPVPLVSSLPSSFRYQTEPDNESTTIFLNSTSNCIRYCIFEFRVTFRLHFENIANLYDRNKTEKIFRSEALDMEKFNNSYNYFSFPKELAFKDIRTDGKLTPQKIFNEIGEYFEGNGTRSVINLPGQIFRYIPSFLHYSEPILNDQRKYNPLINHYQKLPPNFVKRIFLFDCNSSVIARTTTSDLYELFGFDVKYHVEGKYWFNSIKECLDFRESKFNITLEPYMKIMK